MKRIHDFEATEIADQAAHNREVSNLQHLADLYKSHMEEAVAAIGDLENEMKLLQESANTKLANFKDKIGLQIRSCNLFYINGCNTFLRSAGSQQEEIRQLQHEKTLLEDKVGELEGNVSNLQSRVEQSQASIRYVSNL